MKPPRQPHEELLDDDNLERLGTNTDQGIGALSVMRLRAQFFKNAAGDRLVDHLLRMSGSKGGEYRRDMVAALRPENQNAFAFGVPQETPAQEAPGNPRPSRGRRL